MKIRGSEKVIALGAIGAYALVAGVWIALLHVDAASADARPELPEWHAFAACLVGPLEAGDLPSSRLQDIAFAVDEGAEWPHSCLPLARALDSALDAAEPSSPSSLYGTWWCLDSNVAQIRSSLSIQSMPSASAVDQAFECAGRFVAPASSAGGRGPLRPKRNASCGCFPTSARGGCTRPTPI